MDSGSKSDCFLVLFAVDGNKNTRIGETEVIPDNLNPKWVVSIKVDYFFEKQQNFKLEIYDADDANNLQNLAKHDFVGRAEFTLQKVVTGRNQEFTTTLTGGARSQGASVKIMGEEMKPDHAKNIAVFSMNLEMDGNDNKFVLINRSKG